MILVTTEQRKSQPFKIKQQVTIVASGLQGNDVVEFDVVAITASAPASGDPCCTGQVVLPQEIVVAPLNVCGCEPESRVRLTAAKPWIVLDMPQQVPLVARVVAPIDAVVEVSLYETTSEGTVDAGCCPVKLAPVEISELPDLTISELPDLTISELPIVEIKKHVVSSQIVCGELWFVWSDGSTTTKPLPACPAGAAYCASLALPGGGFFYHPADNRDPTATVALTTCSGTVLGYVHPAPGPGHTVEIKSCCPDAVTIGWGVNRSECNVEPNMQEIYQAMCLTAKPSCGCGSTEPALSTDVSVTSEKSFVVVSPSPNTAVGSAGTVTFKIRNTGNASSGSQFLWSFPFGLTVNSASVTYIGGASGMVLSTSQSGQTGVNLPSGGGADVVFNLTAATAGTKVANGSVTTTLTDSNPANNATQQTIIVI
jgi:hypothetical protein